MGRKYIIGDTGYSFITAEWEPDPERISQALMTLSRRVEDWDLGAMDEAKQIVREGVEKRFETETDPYGIPWQELSPEYASWKENQFPGQTILRLSDALFQAATSSDAFIAASQTIEFNASSLPAYAGAHQAGATRSNSNGSGTNTLPQRQFIGIDDDTADELRDWFQYWIDRQFKEVWIEYQLGDPVTTSAGQRGTFTGIHAFPGKFSTERRFLAKGFVSGHFVKGTVPGGRMIRAGGGRNRPNPRAGR